jgi:hypothetical protein
MSEPVPKPAKAEPPSNLSQVLSHGPAYRQAYGPLLGAVLMLVAINKTSRGNTRNSECDGRCCRCC